MKANELSKILHFYSKTGHEDDVILITLSQPSIGSRASVGIQNVFSGFDWEEGQIRIEPTAPLIEKFKDRDIGRPPVCREYDYGKQKRIIRCCPICENHLHKNDNYCSKCGQAIDWDLIK